jgi:hypothetical protein
MNDRETSAARETDVYRQLLHDPELVAIAGDEVGRLDRELRSWAQRPDAFELLLWRSIVARKVSADARG